jgi:hypothetical protein
MTKQAKDKIMTENYDADLARIVTLKSGKLGIETPYNAKFVEELKVNMASGVLQKVRITWDLSREAPQIDGVNLASITRDWWNWRKDCPVDFKVVEQDLDSGGSRKSPGLFGKLVIETSVRPGADISPSAKVEIIEAGEKPNPLADFSTEELLAELKRRGE